MRNLCLIPMWPAAASGLIKPAVGVNRLNAFLPGPITAWRHLLIQLGLMFAIALPLAVLGQDNESVRSKAMARLKVTRCHLEDLPVPASNAVTAIREQRGTVTIPMTIAGERMDVQLHPYSLRSANFKLLVQRDAGDPVEQPAPPPATWRGAVAGKPGSHVTAMIANGMLTASIRLPDGKWWAVQPAKKLVPSAKYTEHLIYDSQDVLPETGACATTGGGAGGALVAPAAGEGAGAGAAEAALPPVPGPVKFAEIAFDADYEYFQLNGGSVAATVADIESILNAVDEIYVRDVGIAYELTTTIVRTGSSDPYSSTDSGTMLTQMRDQWNIHHIGVSRDMAHLMTGQDLDGNIIGKAYTDTICNNPLFAYGLSQSRFSDSFPQRICLTAHELGHNWDACHCNDPNCAPQPQTDCDIMQSSVPGTPSNTFSAISRNQIISHRNSITGRGCLTDGDVYVDAGASWPYLGTSSNPDQTVTDGINRVPTRGRLFIKGPNSYRENITVLRAMSLHALSGPVTIGR